MRFQGSIIPFLSCIFEASFPMEYLQLSIGVPCLLRPDTREEGDLVPNMCVTKIKGRGSFQFQGSDMSAHISVKMGIKVAASLDIGENVC